MKSFCFLLLISHYGIMLTEGSDSPSIFIRAGFIIFKGVVFSDDETFSEVSSPKECNCREACIQDQNCMNYSWKKRGTITTCRLSQEKTGEISTSDNSDGYIAVRVSSNHYLSEDNNLYVTSGDDTSLDNAVNTCNSMGEFDVGIYKTKASFKTLLQVYNKYKKGIWVNLEPKPDLETAHWKDGTPFEDTEVSEEELAKLDGTTEGASYRFEDPQFKDFSGNTRPFIVLCQSTSGPLTQISDVKQG